MHPYASSSFRLAPIALLLTIVISGCADHSTVHVTSNGTVIDDSTSTPIVDAIVVAKWTGHFYNHFECYHVETTRTGADGTFNLQAVISRPEHLDSDEKPGNYPSILVYKPGYELSIKRAQESGAPWATFHTRAIEDMPLVKQPSVRYLVPSTLGRTDRIRYLKMLSGRASCGDSKGNWLKVVPLLTAFVREASAIATTNYEKFLVSGIHCDIENAKGGSYDCFPKAPPIVSAVKARNLDDLRQALKAPGADPNERDADDTTALMIASGYGLVDMVKVLLNAGADPNLIDSEQGTTALHKAVDTAISQSMSYPESYRRQVEVVRTLLSSSMIDVNIKDGSGKTALDYSKGLPNDEISQLIKNRQSRNP